MTEQTSPEPHEGADFETLEPTASGDVETTESAEVEIAPSKADKQIAKAEARAARAAAKAERARARAEKEPTAPWTDSDGGRDWKASAILATGVAALIAALTCLGYFGYYGVSAYAVANSEAAEIRDESIDVAEQAVINITNIDVADVDGWIKRLESSLTGAALEQTRDVAVTQLRKEVEEGRRSSNSEITAVISRSAATEVNVDENTATILVFSTSTARATPEDPGTAVPMQFLVTVVEADGTRKASNIVALKRVPGENAEESGDDGQSDTEGEGGN